LTHQNFCGGTQVIGKGSSGYVRKARRKSTNEVLALKVINVFEEEKRRQMMQEVTTFLNNFNTLSDLVEFFNHD
jgi:hypothetical protein